MSSNVKVAVDVPIDGAGEVAMKVVDDVAGSGPGCRIRARGFLLQSVRRNASMLAVWGGYRQVDVMAVRSGSVIGPVRLGMLG